MSGIEKVPSTPSSPTKSVSLARRLSNMSSTNASRPASSSSTSAASFSAATTSSAPPSVRPLSRANTTLGITPGKQYASMPMGPPPTPGFTTIATTTVTTPTTPTSAVTLSHNSSGDSPRSHRPFSTVTPTISIANISAAANAGNPGPVGMVRTITPPVSSMAEVAQLKGTHAAAQRLAEAQNSQPKTLKSVLQAIIDSVEEAKMHQEALDNSDDMLLEISELRGQLEAADAEFRAYREHMNYEMASYKQKKETELRAFKSSKEKELQEFKTNKTREIEEYKGKKDIEVKGFKSAKEQELDIYKSARNKELEEIKATKARDMEEFKAETLRELEDLQATRAQAIEDAVASTRDEIDEIRRQTEDELARLRTERDTAVFTKESLMAAFEARYAEWDTETRKSSQAEARIVSLQAELETATEKISALTASLAELRCVHEQCAIKDRDFVNNTKGLTAEVAALMVKSKFKTKEANEQRKQATEYKKRYEKSQGRLGMLTLDTKDIGAKFRDLDNSVHDLAWNFFGRELPDPNVKLSSLPGNLWNFPTVPSNSKAAQCLRSALAEALISHQLTARIFQQFYLPHSANVDMDELVKILNWMDHDHADQAQVIRCQIAMVTERFPELAAIPMATAAVVTDILQPWLDLPDARKNFQDGLTNLMQRAMAIWQQMQRGSSLARALMDSSEHQWIATDDGREQYNEVSLDDNGQRQQNAALNFASPEYNQPIAILFPQIYFGLELCFSGHALFASQPSVIAGYAERNSAPMPVNTARRRTSDGPMPMPPGTSYSGPTPATIPFSPLPNNLMGGSMPMQTPNTSMPMERGSSSATSMTGVRPARSSSRQSSNRIAQDFMKKLTTRLGRKGSRTSFQSTANDSGIGTPTHDHVDSQPPRQSRPLGRLTRSMTHTE